MRFFLFNDNMKLIASSYQSGLGALTLFNAVPDAEHAAE